MSVSAEVAMHLLDPDYLEERWLYYLARAEQYDEHWTAGRNAEIARAVERMRTHQAVNFNRKNAEQDGMVTWNNSKKAQRIGEVIAVSHRNAQTYLLAFIATKLRAGQPTG